MWCTICRGRDTAVKANCDGEHQIKLMALMDNKALISRIQQWNVSSLSEVLSPEYDLVQASHSIAKKNLITLDSRHIKSHQDNDCDYEDLTGRPN